jgi:hypothetical protein
MQCVSVCIYFGLRYSSTSLSDKSNVSRSLFYTNKTNVSKTTPKNSNVDRPYKMDYKTIQID